MRVLVTVTLKNNKIMTKKSKGLLVMTIVSILIMILAASCSSKLTPYQVQIDYELEKAYLEYSYQRDSLIIEFYKEQ